MAQRNSNGAKARVFVRLEDLNASYKCMGVSTTDWMQFQSL